MPTGLYRALWWLAIPFAVARLFWRSRRERAYRQQLGERFGRYRIALRGPVIWLHAVSVGETRAAEPLVRALAQAHPDASLLLTHMTPGGRQTARQVYADLIAAGRLASVYLPYDVPFAVRRFVRAFAPAFGLLMETEIWPTLIAECAAAGVPIALVNARLSARSARRAQRADALMRGSIARLALVAAQTVADADRLRAFGARSVTVAGNLKFDVAADPALIERGRAWRAAAGATPGGAVDRPIVLLASTRESGGASEESLLLSALDGPFRNALVVIVPRHAQRFDAVAELAAQTALAVARRSVRGPDASTQLWIGDSMGEMAAYYAMADLAFIGGSLLPLGGQNLIEACACGCPAIVGPHTFNFAQATQDAIDAGAAIRVTDAAGVWRESARWLNDAPALDAVRRAALDFASAHRGATQRTLAALEPLRARLREAERRQRPY